MFLSAEGVRTRPGKQERETLERGPHLREPCSIRIPTGFKSNGRVWTWLGLIRRPSSVRISTWPLPAARFCF